MGYNACPMIPVLHSVIVSPARQQAMSSHTRSDRRDILSAASLSATIFPLKSPLRNQDLFERMFCLSDRCFSATWQHFPQVREAPSFVANECWQADLAYSGLLFESFWRVERRTQVPTKDWARFCHCWWTRSRTRRAMPNEGFHRQLTSNQERFCNDRLGLRNRMFCERCNLAGRCWCSYRCFLTVRDIFKGKHWSLACTGVFEVRLTMDWWILDESLLDMWSSDGKGWLEHPEDTDILIKPSKLYEVIWSPCKPLKFWLCFLIFWQFCNCQVGLHEEMLHFILQLRLLEWHLHSQFWQKTNQSGLRVNNEL